MCACHADNSPRATIPVTPSANSARMNLGGPQKEQVDCCEFPNIHMVIMRTASFGVVEIREAIAQVCVFSSPFSVTVREIANVFPVIRGALQKRLHTPGVTTSNKWPSGSRK